MTSRPCWVEIRTRALEENFRFLARLAAPHAELLAIVKANAYGHSLALCAPAVVRAGAKWLGVTSVEEGIAARALCPNARVLIIGGVFPGQAAAAIQFQLTPVAWEQWQLDELVSAARAAGSQQGSIPVHLEIDTGMSRQGASPSDLAQIFARFGPGSPLRLEGVMTHLCAADEADNQVTNDQLARLDETAGRISAAGLFAEWLNVGASASLLSGQARVISDLAARHGMKAMLRPGLALYGLIPRFDPAFGPGNATPAGPLAASAPPAEPPSLAAARAALQPVLTWKASVASVRSVAAGATIGYNATFVATEPMRVALVSAGYGDGLTRSLGNRFEFLVRGQRAPLIGRVSMDQIVLDVTEIPGVAHGDEVVLIGTQGSETITAFDHADAAGTIPWEIFTRIAPRVPRIPV
ncbi:MAG TPA: alanine racemase [Terracidiphilus sp.]|nr:alanine racemase [Terracidiphilus sp.]